MKAVQYADCSLQEYQRRIQKVSEAMANADLDALIVTDPANLRYLFGFQNLLLMSANRAFLGLFFRENPDESVLYLPPDCQDAPQSWCENICFWTDGMLPPFDERYVDIEKVSLKLNELSLARGSIGMEMGPGARLGLPINEVDALRRDLDDAVFKDCADILWDARKIKSEEEIFYLQQIAEISRYAHEYALAHLHEGITEKELYCQLQSYLFGHGADGLGLFGILFGAKGWRRANMSPSNDVRLRENDWVYLDGGGVLSGYNADMCRMGVLGEPEQRRTDVYQTVQHVQQAMIAAIKPGLPCSEIYKTGCRLLQEAGLYSMISTRSFGHGVGLNVHEMPDISLDNNEPLQEGMVLAIEPWIIDHSELGLFNYEDMIVVRAHGAEILSSGRKMSVRGC